jgi:molecular chaperone GrpE
LKLAELQDKYIRLSAEFDNYRKRTLKERADLIKSAGGDMIVRLLPVMDDFERAMSSMGEAKDIEAVKAGVYLIYSKFRDFLNQQGVKEIEAVNKDFDTDVHEAITKIPAPEDNLKGKIVEVVEKGYYLNDKILRYAKVVIGE